MSTDGGGPAFPCQQDLAMGGTYNSLGMTLRDYFAAATLMGLSVNSYDPQVIAQNAYALADAMLEERSK